MIEIEREKTYLAKWIPGEIKGVRSEIIRDIYVPETVEHATLRLRAKGEKYEITKKEPVVEDDSTKQNEHTITLIKAEYDALAACSKKQFAKRRYYCKIGGYDAEVDVYLEDLEGLVVIDFEFTTDEQMALFKPPEVCLADVSQDALIAGGKLAGRTYEDLRPELEAYGYEPLKLKGEA